MLVASYTKREVKEHQSVEDLCNDSNAILLSKPKSLVSNASLALDTGHQEVIKHHIDFIKCDNIDPANTQKELFIIASKARMLSRA